MESQGLVSLYCIVVTYNCKMVEVPFKKYWSLCQLLDLLANVISAPQ